MGPTALFTHLKIILLQYFQFSIFSFSNNKFNPNEPNISQTTKELVTELVSPHALCAWGLNGENGSS